MISVVPWLTFPGHNTVVHRPRVYIDNDDDRNLKGSLYIELRLLWKVRRRWVHFSTITFTTIQSSLVVRDADRILSSRFSLNFYSGKYDSRNPRDCDESTGISYIGYRRWWTPKWQIGKMWETLTRRGVTYKKSYQNRSVVLTKPSKQT